MARALSGAALAARAPLAGAATGASAPTAPATRVAIVDSAKPASGAGAGPLGPIRADRVVVTKGIEPGEKVVTHGAIYLGAQVSDD